MTVINQLEVTTVLNTPKSATYENSVTVDLRENALKLLRKLIVQTLGKNPTGRTGIVLWGQARKSSAGYTLQEFDETLSSLRNEGGCTLHE